jgi:hypothetical protein
MFEYQPLNYSNNETRLIHLAPGQDVDPIRCKLVHVSLNDQPTYHALSYCWGSDAEKQKILLETSEFVVTKNLFEAMRALRSSTEDLVVWIDAICINQKDVLDRNEQVKRMRYIYESAAIVDVWLGPAAEDSTGAMSIVRDMAKGLWVSEMAKNLVKTSNGNQKLRALVKLFRREYWQRTWVIQEFSLAKMAIVHCGPDSVSREELESVSGMSLQWRTEFSTAFSKDFDQAMGSLEGRNFVPGDFSTTFSGDSSSMSVLATGGPKTLQPSKGKHTFRGQPRAPSELLDCLIWHRFKDATNPRDKVYGLAGITLGATLLQSADYGHSVRQVYQDTVKYVVETTQKLDIICASRPGPDSANLPSWTPDWRNYDFKHRVRDLYYSVTKFTASGTSLPEARFSVNGGVLTARGLYIDTINTVGIPCVMEHTTDIDRAIEAFHNWHGLLVQVKGPAMEHGIAFCSTLWCNPTQEFLTPVQVAAYTFAAFLILLRVAVADYEPSAALLAFEKQLKAPSNAKLWEDSKGQSQGRVTEYAQRMHGRRFFATNKDSIGMGLQDVAVGDLVCVLLGCTYPVILRPRAGHVVFMGEAYIDGYMLGEAMEGLPRDATGSVLSTTSDGKRVLHDFELH